MYGFKNKKKEIPIDMSDWVERSNNGDIKLFERLASGYKTYSKDKRNQDYQNYFMYKDKTIKDRDNIERLSFKILPQQSQFLNKEAERTGKSKATLIREALDKVYNLDIEEI